MLANGNQLHPGKQFCNCHDGQGVRLHPHHRELVVILKGDWVYSVQVSIKFTYIPASSGQQATVQKIRIQASGHLANISKGRLKEAFQGYDSVVLQNVFQDLQAKLGPR
jgi:hypothetical protein